MGLSVYPQIETLRKLRLYVLNAVNEFSADQLNKIPSGLTTISSGMSRIWWPHRKA
ncbi:hypothetical protein [Pedobacter frigoris]|uniref:hypothetical protein n=1 Tax=Pedobacter frigoris TaxID=2571272 RepID=UPI00292FC4A1|nr:hypothetical protein [Pedobacter frigoris]